MLASCTNVKGCCHIVLTMKLTGNTDNEALYRAAEMILSNESQSTSHVYDCVRNPNYHVTTKFKWRVFSSSDQIVLYCRHVECREALIVGKKKHPIGTKAAKKAKEQRRLNANCNIPDKTVAGAMNGIENSQQPLRLKSKN